MRLRLSVILLFVTALVFVVSTAISGQSPLVPQGDSGEVYIAPAPVAITLDGNLSDWSLIPFADVTTGPNMSGQPISARFAAAADADWLYVVVDVSDSTLIAGRHEGAYWDEDSVEIYLNTGQDRQITSYTGAVTQITIPALNIGRSVDQTIFGGINYEQVGVRGVVVATGSGYAVEVAIPLRNGLWNINTSPNHPIGFQVMINSASAQNRDYKLSWSNADQTADVSYQNPSVFGELLFAMPNGDPGVIPTSTPLAALEQASRGEFRVSGSTILTPNGSPFIARGVNVSGLNWVWERPTVWDADNIVNCWGFNVVRVNNFLFMGQVQWSQYTTNNNLDELVNAFTSRGIVVILEAHDRIGSYYQGDDLDALVNWFTDLADRYKNNPYVWFDVMNEPGGRNGVDVDQWLNMHGRVIQAIRGTGANNIIIVEGAYGGQDTLTDSAILRLGQQLLTYNGQQFSNIVFSIHPYDLWNNGGLGAFIDQVHAQNLALIIGEYAIQTDQNVEPAARAVFDEAVPRGVGIIVWHWDSGDANDLTVNTSRGGGWEIDDCTNPTNLSWFGQQVWNTNH